jgi:ssDNA-binding Zn-finger/Zn-ribbon topoisomerase 1
MENIAAKNNWDWRIYCNNQRCDFKVELKIKDLKDYFDEKFGKEIFENIKDYDVNIFSHLYDEIMCGECDNFPLSIINSKHEMVLDPDNIIPCAECDKPILLTRLNIKKSTKICTPCARKEELSTAEKIKIHNDQAIPKSPIIPNELSKCKKCGSDSTTRYSPNNGEWFIGCSTFPNCWWKKAFPKKVHGKFSITEFDILSGFEELIDVALKARKNKDIDALKIINSEFYRRISNKEMAGKSPTKTAKKGFEQTEIWLKELENK